MGQVDIVRISKAMSQCSGVLVTPWGKVDIAKDLWLRYQCSEAIYDFMGQSDRSKVCWVIEVVNIVCFTH